MMGQNSQANPMFLVLIAGLCVLGVLIFALRAIASLTFSLLFDFAFPTWVFPCTSLLCFAVLWLYPSITGRTVTAILARRIGFLSLRLESLHIWNLKNMWAEGIVLESPSMGTVRIRSIQIKPNWKDMYVHVEVSDLRIEMKESALIQQQQQPRLVKRKKRAPMPFFSLLRLAHHIQVNVDYIELKRASVTCRTRDFTATLKQGEFSGQQNAIPALIVHAGLGMFTLSIALEDDNYSTQRSGRSRLPPLIELNQANVWFHLSSSLSGADLAMPLRVITPQRGLCLSVSGIQVAASSASLVALKKSFPAKHSSTSPPPTPTTSSSNPHHPFLEHVEPILTKYNVDPVVMFVDTISVAWYDAKGMCVSTAVSAFEVQVSRSSGVVVKTSQLVCSSLSSPFLVLEAIHVEVLDEEDILQVACVFTEMDSVFRPLAVTGLERAHVEWLRYVARTRPVLDFDSMSSTTLESTALQPVIPFQGIVEFVCNGGVSFKLATDDVDLDSSVCLTIDTLACRFATVEQREKYIKVETCKLGVDGAPALRIQRFIFVLDSPTNTVALKMDSIITSVAVGTVFRGFKLWLCFAPQLDRWQESCAEIRATELLSSPLAESSNQAATGASVDKPMFASSQSFKFQAKIQDFQLNALFGEGKGVRLVVPQITLSSERVLQMHKINIIALDLEDSVSLVQIQCIELASGTLKQHQLQATVTGFHVHIPSQINDHHRPFAGGEILTAYFRQRKALRVAMKEATDEAPPRSRGLRYVNLAPDLVRDDSDVEKQAFLVTIRQICVEFEDDQVEDRTFTPPSFFPHERRRSSSKPGAILSFACPEVIMQGSVVTAWRSSVSGAITDLALLKRAPSMQRAHRTRAYILKQVYEYDSSSCPKPRMDRAFMHGFADLISIELDQFDIGPGALLLSDYALPVASFDSLQFGACNFVFADLKPAPCSTTPAMQLVLGEIDCAPLHHTFTVQATSSLAPVKFYFKVPHAVYSNLQLCYGECLSPALVALDRALARVLPLSSDKSSPKLGWWDKMRYLSHGKSHFVLANGFQLRLLTNSPWLPEDCIWVRCTEGTIGESAEDVNSLEQQPGLGLDQRAWDMTFSDYTMHLCKTASSADERTKFQVFTLPRLYALVSFAWRSRFGGDHYVQLHHDGATLTSQVPDQYAHFRSQSLDVGLDFEIKRAQEDDYLPQDKCPTLDVCWRAMYPVYCASWRGMFPPGPVRTPPEVITLGRCLTKITFNVRCSRPHITYWEDDTASTAFLMRGKRVDSQLVLSKNASTGKWEHEALLAQFFAVESFILTRNAPRYGRIVDFEREFGIGEADYCFGVSLPQEPFFVAPCMRLTLGSWTKLVGAAESQTYMGEPREEREDSIIAYKLCVDGARLMWTLSIRNDVSRFFATVSYIMRLEQRKSSELAQQHALPNTPPPEPFRQENQRRMDLSLLYNRSLTVETAAGGSAAGADEMTAKMAAFLRTASGGHPIVGGDDDQNDIAAENTRNKLRDRPSACSTAEVSADMLKSTWEESSRSFTLEMRWAQVSFQSERNVMVISSQTSTLRNFSLGLIDWINSDTCLLRKEMNVELNDVTVFATVLGEGVTGTRCVRMMQKSKSTIADEVMDDLTAFESARGSVRRGVSGQAFLEAALALVNKFQSPDERKYALLDARVKRLGGDSNFYDITSPQDQDPNLERIGDTDRFQITNIVYTDTSGGAKVPSAHFGVKMRTANASLKSREFFAVLAVIRNLLLEGPPPDVKELSILTQQEAIDELKRRWRSHHPLAEADTANDATTIAASAAAEQEENVVLHSEAELKAHVERVCAGRLNAKRLQMCSQRIIYELEEFNVKLKDQEERIHAQAFRMRGDHSFSPDGSTKVDFELGDLKAFDLQTHAQLVECQLLESFQDHLTRAPFLRADAMTSSPIHAFGYRVTVYELIQVHLFPGTRYRFRTRVSQSNANFVRKYLVGEDDVTKQDEVAASGSALSATSAHELSSNNHAVQLAQSPTLSYRRRTSSGMLLVQLGSDSNSLDSPTSAHGSVSGGGGTYTGSISGAATTSGSKKGGGPQLPAKSSSAIKPRFSLSSLFSNKQQSSDRIRGGGDEEDEDEDAVDTYERQQEEPATLAATPQQLIIRSGTVTRLSVPKTLQVRPEPTIQPWNTTQKRKSIAMLVVRKQESFLELHRTEMGIRVGVPARASIRLQDIFKIQRHHSSASGQDDIAPEGAIDIFYNVDNGPMSSQGVFTWLADEPGWSGEDRALPWIAAMAPGLNKDVLNAFFKQELKSALLEPIWKRSAAAMGKPNVLFPSNNTRASRSSTYGGGDQDMETDNDDYEDEETVEEARLARHFSTASHGSIAVPPPPPSSRVVSAQEPQRREINFFKFMRVGQIQVELTLQGFPFVNNLQRNAYCPAEVYHSQLWTWYKAFKIVQRYEVVTLLTSYLRGGSGANWEDNNSNAALVVTTPSSPSNSASGMLPHPPQQHAQSSSGFFKRRTATTLTSVGEENNASHLQSPAAPSQQQHPSRERRRSDFGFFGPHEDHQFQDEGAKIELLFGSKARHNAASRPAAVAAAARNTSDD